MHIAICTRQVMVHQGRNLRVKVFVNIKLSLKFKNFMLKFKLFKLKANSKHLVSFYKLYFIYVYTAYSRSEEVLYVSRTQLIIV